MFLMGYITFKKTGTVNGAKWYGKVTTVTLYAVMVVLFLLPNIPMTVASLLISLCYIVVIGSLILYTRFYFVILKEHKKNTQA